MAEFSGAYSPVPDCIVEDLGREAALVYGAVWRYCFFSSRGLCDASTASIAKRAGLKDRKTRECLNALVERGWLERVSKPGKPSVLYDSKRWVTHQDADSAKPKNPRSRRRTPASRAGVATE